MLCLFSSKAAVTSLVEAPSDLSFCTSRRLQVAHERIFQWSCSLRNWRQAHLPTYFCLEWRTCQNTRKTEHWKPWVCIAWDSKANTMDSSITYPSSPAAKLFRREILNLGDAFEKHVESWYSRKHSHKNENKEDQALTFSRFSRSSERGKPSWSSTSERVTCLLALRRGTESPNCCLPAVSADLRRFEKLGIKMNDATALGCPEMKWQWNEIKLSQAFASMKLQSGIVLSTLKDATICWGCVPIHHYQI